MRILHILGEKGLGGGEDQLLHLLAHLAQQGHENRLVLQPGAQLRAPAEALPVPVDTVRMRNALDPWACRSLRRLIADCEPDLVHLACSRAHKLGGFATMTGTRPRMLVTRRMDRPLSKGRFSRWLYRRVVCATVVVSEAVRQEVVRIGADPETVHLIHDGVVPERFEDLGARRVEARERLALDAEAQVIVCAATLGRHKGQIHLLHAFAALAAQHPKARLLLAGHGRERRRLEREIDKLRLEARVLMPGRLAREDCHAVADIACLPSLREGLSVFTLEAQAAGLPVVASRIGGLPESVADGVSGLLVPPGDESALAAALDALLKDPERRRALGAAGRERVRTRFTAGAMAERTEALYTSLVGG